MATAINDERALNSGVEPIFTLPKDFIVYLEELLLVSKTESQGFNDEGLNHSSLHDFEMNLLHGQ